MDFCSDNSAPICPDLMAAMVDANSGAQPGYGADSYSAQLNRLFSDFFETEVAAFVVPTGTAANALALATLCPPWGAILCHRESHIERDECGAPEFYTGGAKLCLLGGAGAKITPDSLAVALRGFQPMVHMVQPRLLSLTQATERGACYDVATLTTLAGMAHAAGLRVHMDGARLANALVALDVSPAAMTWQAGIDVLSFGATKNGGYACEAVVFFPGQTSADFDYRRKRGGHLGCKARYAAAQWAAYLKHDLWRRNAAHANAMAARIADAATARLTVPPQTNQIFLRLTEVEKAALRGQGFAFYDWGDAGSAEARFVTGWHSDAADVARLCAALAALP